MKTIIKLSKKLSDGYANIPIRDISKLKDLNFNLRYYLLCLFDLTSTEKFNYELTALKLSRYCGDNGNNPTRYGKYINDIKKLGYIYEDSDGNTTINIERIEAQCIKFVNKNDLIIKEKKRIKNIKQLNRKNNKNTSTDTINLKQVKLSQESNINTSIENKTSQIEEKQPLNENQNITLIQEENIQDITLNDNFIDDSSSLDLYDENTSTDIENLQQEQLSQESNINTQEETIVAVNEEKELIIKERFQDYVTEYLDTDEYEKTSNIFNILINNVKFQYSTSLIKKVYYDVKNRYVNSNEKLERLVTLIDIIIKHFKLEDYFNDNNFVENSIDYILKDNYTENGLIRYNQNHYTENKNEPVVYTQVSEINNIEEPKLPLKIKTTDDDNELVMYLDSNISKSVINNFNRFTTESLIELYLMYVDSYKECHTETEKFQMFTNNQGYIAASVKQLFELTYNIIVDYKLNPTKFSINIDEIINSYEYV